MAIKNKEEYGGCWTYPREVIDEALESTDSAIEEIQDDITELTEDMEDITVTDLSENLIAPGYSDLTFPVTAGQHCTHLGKYYYANQDIASSESWTAAHWTETTVGAETSSLKSGLNKYDNLIFDYTTVFTASGFVSNNNSAITDNGDGTYSVGTNDYGTTVFGATSAISAGKYILFGTSAGFSFVSTSTNYNNAIATNDTGASKEITIENDGIYYIGMRLTAKPSASFTVTPALIKIESVFDQIDDSIDEINDSIDEINANVSKMLHDDNLLTVSLSTMRHSLGDATISYDPQNGFAGTRVTAQNNLYGFNISTQAKKTYHARFKVVAGNIGSVYICPTDEYNTGSAIDHRDNISPGSDIDIEFVAQTGTTSLWFNQNYAVAYIEIADIYVGDDILRYNHYIMDYPGNEICTFNKILCIGDSLTEGTFNYSANNSNDNVIADAKYSYPTYLTKMTGVTTYNHGHGGYTAEEWYTAYEETDLSGYDACIIMLGINDAVEEVGVQNFSTNMSNIIDKVKTDNDGIRVFIATLIPAYSDYDTKFNNYITEIKRLVAEDYTDCFLVDINQYSVCKAYTPYVQGHLTAIGYQQLAKEFKTLISYIMHNNLESFRNVQFIGTEYTYNLS